jgi:endo-alpha-1,4-polygalactosaminidase (GH114 family)
MNVVPTTTVTVYQSKNIIFNIILESHYTFLIVDVGYA